MTKTKMLLAFVISTAISGCGQSAESDTAASAQVENSKSAGAETANAVTPEKARAECLDAEGQPLPTVNNPCMADATSARAAALSAEAEGTAEDDVAASCERKWAYIPPDKASGANALMIWLREDRTYVYQSGDGLNEEQERGDYYIDADKGPDAVNAYRFWTDGETEFAVSECTSRGAKVKATYPADYEETMKLVPFSGDLIEELERLGYDRAPT
jgi:hypothetical protein